MRRCNLLGALAACIAGCSFAPPYSVPTSVTAPERYRASNDWKVAEPSDQVPRGAWWKAYSDRQLDLLESMADNANETLKAAFARLQQARADTRIARADLFPSVVSKASAERLRISPNSPQYVEGRPTQGNDFDVEGDLTYELDLWGRVRNQAAAARATQQATAADLGVMRLSIQAEVASDYFRLRSYDTQEQLLDKTVGAYQKALDLTQTLFDNGAAALADVEQAKAQLFTVKTQAVDTRLLRAQLEHGIAVLVGENPSTFFLLSNPLPQQSNPPTIDPGIPSTLLERRPDVAEAERRVASANAQIGEARAAYFPQITLVPDAGFNSLRASSLFGAPSEFWSLGPQVVLPLFEGGRLIAQTEKAKAAYREQVASYRNTVLTAYQEVEDNLVALRQLEQEASTEAQAVESSNIALSKSQNRYVGGLVTYLEVSTTESTALQAQLSLINIQTRRFDASIMLIKALGGGWHDDAATLGQND